jgi:hypothetical protein
MDRGSRIVQLFSRDTRERPDWRVGRKGVVLISFD